MKNKGFTLIELLAVIVILAIIALIATPVILNIINDTRDSANKESANFVVSTAKLAYSTAYLKEHTGNGSKAGMAPSLDEVKTALEANLDNATVAVAGSTITVTTKDKVVCEFTNTSKKLSFAGCKKEGSETNDVLAPSETATENEIGDLNA